VAVTGKLIRHLYTRRDIDGWIYRAVLAKANVFARMAPDDKAMLVSSLQNALLG
jgi:magnesium-transporting ATPase (P-type)